MISNPCTWFKNSHEQIEYLHEGGRYFYHFSPYDSKLSRTHEMNIVFFANSTKHATELLEKMLKFKLKCMRKHTRNGRSTFRNEWTMRDTIKMKSIKDLLAHKNKWVIKRVNRNQFFVVGWASNDTI